MLAKVLDGDIAKYPGICDEVGARGEVMLDRRGSLANA
jgi:hypothetical protein